jgi:hypothetical protein
MLLCALHKVVAVVGIVQVARAENMKNIVLFKECTNSPEIFLTSVQEKYKSSAVENCLLVCLYHFPQPWAEKNQILEIVYSLVRKQNNLVIEKFSVSENIFLFSRKNSDNNSYETLISEFHLQQNLYSLHEPFFMDPVFIPKPWGQEIWYTGVEKRGVSKVFSSFVKQSIPYPWLFAALPKALLGEKYAQKNLVLVKILDPLPQEVVGDLYYELHQEKNEVYVVTHIENNVGQIKMGIHPEKIAQYKNNEAQLKADFIATIEKYEVVRRKIDALLDAAEQVPANLTQDEISLRKNMDAFAGYLNLQVGDVISVPILVPHALQHGVRVIEFQTPTYERLIISFAQKVLTQTHWDTKRAFEVMQLQTPQKQELIKLKSNENYLEELVCAFPDFYSVRVKLNSLQEYALKCLAYYQVLFIVTGEGTLSMQDKHYALKAGQCVFIPAQCSATLTSMQEIRFLICAPEKF